MQGLPAVWVVGVNGTGRAELTEGEPLLATSPSVSPDGTTIAYVYGDGRIWLMDADGTNRRPLGPEAGNLEGPSAPTWSPRGGNVAYTLVRLVPASESECASWSAVVRDAATGGLVREFDGALSPTWSPQAKRVAFESNQAHCKQPGSVGVAALTGTRQRFFGKLGDTTPAWSPDGRWLAFYCRTARPGLCVGRPDGRSVRRIAGAGPTDLDWPAPSWSPDGKKVVFATARRRVKVVTVSSGRSRLLGPGMAPSWSPNGRSIAVFSGAALAVRDARTGKGRAVTPLEGRFELVAPAWSPDGKRLYFTSAGE